MRPLVELELAKQNLHVTTDLDDDNLTVLLNAASLAILTHVKMDHETYEPAGSPLVTPEVPWIFQQATLLALRSLYDDPTVDPITPAVTSLLRASRVPTLA